MIWLWILEDAYDSHVTDWQSEDDDERANIMYLRLLDDKVQITRTRTRLAALRS